jgi:uncharacterized protein YcgI (DUF1989 family)
MEMSLSPGLTIVPRQSAVAFVLPKGATLTIVDPNGSQVADLTAFAGRRTRTILVRPHDRLRIENRLPDRTLLYSNRSNPMLEIVHDDVDRHDCLLSPCSARMFEILRCETAHPSCHGNLAKALAPYGIGEDAVLATFNAFMNVTVTPDGALCIAPPTSKAGDAIARRAHMDLIVGLSACSSEYTNGGQRGNSLSLRLIPLEVPDRRL